MAYLLKQMTTVYTDANGNRVPSSTPGAVKSTIESSKWYCAGVPGWPKSKRKALATDRRVAQQMLSKLVEKAERGLNGMANTDLARADLAGLVIEFEADMLLGLATKSRSTRKRPSQEQVDLAGQRLRTLVAGCGFVTVADLNDTAPRKAARYLTGRAALPRKDGGLSAKSCEDYRKVIGRFAWWLSERKNAPVRSTLFADLPTFDFRREKVHGRRALTDAELAALLDATRESGVEEYGLTSEDRHLLYSTAVGTGFRVSELASLTPSSFQLTGPNPTVTLAGKRSKNRNAAINPISPALARRLVPYLAGKPADQAIWNGTWVRDNKGAEILRRDLKRAGIPYKVDSAEGPRYADFHSLRHYYVTRLAGLGVNPKELQTLARHADAQTTLSHYVHTNPEALAAAVGRLPSPGGEEQGVDDLSRLPREELELLVRSLATRLVIVEGLASFLFTPPFTPAVDSTGDGLSQPETPDPKKPGRRDTRRRREAA